jgi:zinc transporter ZupT
MKTVASPTLPDKVGFTDTPSLLKAMFPDSIGLEQAESARMAISSIGFMAVIPFFRLTDVNIPHNQRHPSVSRQRATCART